MRVTVTGAAGTLGLAATEMAVRAGHAVRAFVRDESRFRGLCRDPRVEVVEGDIRVRADAAEGLAGSEAIIHCVDFPAREFLDNWDAIRHALEALTPGGHFVYPGNVWVYGRAPGERVGPDHAKASPSKLGAVRGDLEKAVTAEGGTVVHLPEVYGPGVRSGPTHELFRRALAGRTVYYPGQLDRALEFLYISDAARALIAPLGRKAARGADYTAPGYGITTPRQFAQLVFKAAARDPRIRSLPTALVRALDLLRPERRPLRDLSYLIESPILMDGTRIRHELGWLPEVDYPEGVRRTLRWLRPSP
jgi:nucleoside-diphosphate-sugar epimerase